MGVLRSHRTTTPAVDFHHLLLDSTCPKSRPLFSEILCLDFPVDDHSAQRGCGHVASSMFAFSVSFS